MIEILLQYLRAEREGLWDLHLATTSSMLPYFFACGHINYARWVAVYLADMKLLSETFPDVHSEFCSGNFGVKHTEKPFNQIWSDMALEQSINRHVKSKGGVIGFSTKPLALQRWFLTAHVRASVTSATKHMFGVDEDRTLYHKEAGIHRIVRDEADVQNVVCVLKETMINPFSDAENNMKLINIASGTIAPDDVSKGLLDAEFLGFEDMIQFVEQRLITTKVDRRVDN